MWGLGYQQRAFYWKSIRAKTVQFKQACRELPHNFPIVDDNQEAIKSLGCYNLAGGRVREHKRLLSMREPWTDCAIRFQVTWKRRSTGAKCGTVGPTAQQVPSE